MAKNDSYLIANPTPEAIESAKGKVIVPAGRVKRVTINDEVNAEDLVQFICEGCVVAPASKTNASFTSNDTNDTLVQLVEKGVDLLRVSAHTALSAGTSTFAQSGL